MAHQAAARVADVSGGGKVEEAETRASAVAEQAVSAACPLCGAAPLELYTKSGTQFRDHYRCSKHSSGPCPYKETVVALAAFMRPRKCAKPGAPHVLQYQGVGEDGAVNMKCNGCRYSESSRPSA